MFWPRPLFKIADCDLESSASARVSWNMKSSGDITLDRFVQASGGHAVDPRQFPIQDHSLAPQQKDRLCDLLDGDGRCAQMPGRAVGLGHGVLLQRSCWAGAVSMT